jgi:crotonobetainyl-CoA:carnitine CoA-transferase CaiB-like acyl-CoA transferase
MERAIQRPLEGIRVLDCGVFHAGPGGPAILGDLGAEVIKIEQPGVGDPIRMAGQIGKIQFGVAGGRGLFFEGANRSKKGITLNLKSEKGRAILYRLVEQSDVFLTNLRPPAVERLKIGYPALREVNPRLIYASVSAYGPKGPDRDLGGFDYQGQARSGLMYSMGEAGTPPVACQFGIIDQATAIMASHQIITALFMRERTGIGQQVHLSILSAAMYLLYFNILLTTAGGMQVPRHRRATENPMRNYYRCGDGGWLMMTLTPPERHWGPLCAALGHPELENDPRYDTDEKRSANAAELVAWFDEIFASRPRDAWLRIFAEHDLFACAINTLEELATDPQVVANDYLESFDHPVLGEIKLPGYPVHFSESRAGTTLAAPDLGEHTVEVLSKLCGYGDEEIEALRAEGVV